MSGSYWTRPKMERGGMIARSSWGSDAERSELIHKEQLLLRHLDLQRLIEPLLLFYHINSKNLFDNFEKKWTKSKAKQESIETWKKESFSQRILARIELLEFRQMERNEIRKSKNRKQQMKRKQSSNWWQAHIESRVFFFEPMRSSQIASQQPERKCL